MCFIDRDKIFHRIDRRGKWVILKEIGTSERTIKATHTIYENGKICVRIQGKSSQRFETTTLLLKEAIKACKKMSKNYEVGRWRLETTHPWMPLGLFQGRHTCKMQ